jgi:hypothetical protein
MLLESPEDETSKQIRSDDNILKLAEDHGYKRSFINEFKSEITGNFINLTRDTLLFQSGYAFNSFVVSMAKTLGFEGLIGVTYEQAQDHLRYLAVRNHRREIRADSIALFKSLELVWIEVNLDAYPPGTTWDQATDRERQSVEHWFELAKYADAKHKIPDVVFVEGKILEGLLDRDLWAKEAKSQKLQMHKRMKKERESYLKPGTKKDLTEPTSSPAKRLRRARK